VSAPPFALVYTDEALRVVANIDKARAELISRGVEVSAIQDVGGEVNFAGLADPDGKTSPSRKCPGKPETIASDPGRRSGVRCARHAFQRPQHARVEET